MKLLQYNLQETGWELYTVSGKQPDFDWRKQD